MRRRCFLQCRKLFKFLLLANIMVIKYPETIREALKDGWCDIDDYAVLDTNNTIKDYASVAYDPASDHVRLKWAFVKNRDDVIVGYVTTKNIIKLISKGDNVFCDKIGDAQLSDILEVENLFSVDIDAPVKEATDAITKAEPYVVIVTEKGKFAGYISSREYKELDSI